MIRASDDLLSPSVHGRKNASRIRSVQTSKPCDPRDDSLTITIDTADMHGLEDVQSARIAASELARALESQSSILNSSQGQQRLRRPGIGRQPSATARGCDRNPKAVVSARSSPRCISLHASSSFDKPSFDVNESELPPLSDASSSEICSDLPAEVNDDVSHDRRVADANVYRRLRFGAPTAAPQATTTAAASFEAQVREMPSKQIKSEAPLQTSYSASTTAVSPISSPTAWYQPAAPAVTQRAAGLPSGLMQRRRRGVVFEPESKNLDHATANPTTPPKTPDRPRPCGSIQSTIYAAEHDCPIATSEPSESPQPTISSPPPTESNPGSRIPSPQRRASVPATGRQISCTQQSPLQHPKQPSRIPSPSSNYWQSAKSHRAASAGSHAKTPQSFTVTESNVHCFKESPSKLPVLGEVRAAAAATSALRPPTTPFELSDALRTPRPSTRRMNIGAYPGAPTINLEGRSGGCSPVSPLHSTRSMLSSPLLQHSPLRHKAIV